MLFCVLEKSFSTVQPLLGSSPAQVVLVSLKPRIGCLNATVAAKLFEKNEVAYVMFKLEPRQGF